MDSAQWVRRAAHSKRTKRVQYTSASTSTSGHFQSYTKQLERRLWQRAVVDMPLSRPPSSIAWWGLSPVNQRRDTPARNHNQTPRADFAAKRLL